MAPNLPSERSPAAFGRLVAVIDRAITPEFLEQSQVVVDEYETGRSHNIPGGLLASLAKLDASERDNLRTIERTIDQKLQIGQSLLAQRVDANLTRLLLENRFDVHVLVKCEGGIVALQHAIEIFCKKVSKDCLFTTYVSSKAQSAGHKMFAAGDRRFARPDSKFMMHDAIDIHTRNSSDTPERWTNEVDNPYFDRVLASIQQPQREAVEHVLRYGPKGEAGERRLDCLGEDVPGFVTDYFDLQSSFSEQLSLLLGRQIHLQQYANDPIAAYTLFSELEIAARTGGVSVDLSLQRGFPYIMGLKKAQIPDFLSLVNKRSIELIGRKLF